MEDANKTYARLVAEEVNDYMDKHLTPHSQNEATVFMLSEIAVMLGVIADALVAERKIMTGEL